MLGIAGSPYRSKIFWIQVRVHASVIIGSALWLHNGNAIGRLSRLIRHRNLPFRRKSICFQLFDHGRLCHVVSKFLYRGADQHCSGIRVENEILKVKQLHG